MKRSKQYPYTRILRILPVLLVVFATRLSAQTPPVAVNDTLRLCEGTTVLVDLLANDTDADGDDLETDILSGPASVLIDYDDDGLPEGQYWVSIESGFTGTDVMIYEVCGDDDDLCDIALLVIIVAGTDGCVWPGDANQDSICNVIDLLPIGVYYGVTGPDREDDDGTWEESFCDEWDDLPGIFDVPNPKFADCNGDGEINDADTTIIADNYGSLRGMYVPEAFIGGPDDPAIALEFFSDTLPAGTAVSVPILLGSDAIPADDMYGIAFQIDYDETVIDAPSVTVQFDGGWLGTPGADVLYMQKNDTVNGIVEVSITRNNHISRTGSGYFGQVSFVMEDNIAGKMQGQVAVTTQLCISQPLAINAIGAGRPLQTGCDSVVVVELTNTIDDSGMHGISVFPNPANNDLQLYLPTYCADCMISLHSITGQIVQQWPFSGQQAHLSTTDIPSGAYLLEIQSTTHTTSMQCIIQH